MNRYTRGALQGFAAILLSVGLIAVLSPDTGAQIKNPSGPSTGSPVVGTLVASNPTAGTACTSYNVFDVNATTGDFTPCANGLWGGSTLHTGVTTNTDLAGSVTLSSGAGSYTFKGTYASAPFCVATDSTAAAATKASTTTTTLTLAGTTTDVLRYICVVTK